MFGILVFDFGISLCHFSVQISWLGGNAAHQTVMTSLYCHPTVIQSLQLALGLPVSRHTVATTDLFSEGGSPPLHPIEPLHVSASGLEAGTCPYVCALSVLALSTSTLRCMALSHKAILETGVSLVDASQCAMP